MKKKLEPISLAVLTTVVVTMLSTGCANPKEAQQVGTATFPVYDTTERIKAMPRCEASVNYKSPCAVGLISADGKRFYIGSPGATLEVTKFLPTLQSGHTYTLPDVFLDYQKYRK